MNLKMFARCYFRVCGGKVNNYVVCLFLQSTCVGVGSGFVGRHICSLHVARGVTERVEYARLLTLAGRAWVARAAKRFHVCVWQRLIYAGVSKFVCTLSTYDETEHRTCSILMLSEFGNLWDMCLPQ